MQRTALMAVVFSVMMCAACRSARAEAPVQLALFHPVQLIQDYDNVRGFRFDILYGVNFNVTGLDVGLVNQVDGFLDGVQVGVYNNSYEAHGLQVGIVNRAGWLKGLQIGLVNINANGRHGFLPILNFSF